MYSLKMMLICMYTKNCQGYYKVFLLCQGYYKVFLLSPKQSTPSLIESISVPWFRLLSLENENFSTSTDLYFRSAEGKGWNCGDKSLWSIISLSNCLGANKYGFCSCLLTFKNKKKNNETI